MSKLGKGLRTTGILARRFVLLPAAFLLAGCATVKVTTDYDPAARFGKYRTYVLAPAPHGEGLSAMSEAALRAALRVNLSARGIEERASGQPDMEIVRHVFKERHLTAQQYASRGYGPGASWPDRDGRYAIWAGAPADFTNPGAYADGALVLDFVDRRTRMLLFRGAGRGAAGDRKSSTKVIEDAVAKIVAGLPGPPGH